MNWVKDAKNRCDGRLMVHIRTRLPLVLRCQEVIDTDKRWTYLQADVEVYCHDRSALSTCDFPSMCLELPEQEEVVDVREFGSFMNLNLRTCGIAFGRSGRFVIPSRLLQIDWNARRIRLLVMPPGPPGASWAPELMTYATLSHCWSDTDRDVPRLLKSNLRDWMAGVCIDHLPHAIQDAVEVAYVNRLHFLWIESLCIIQDDEADYQVQKPYIGAYFRDSAVTIVAASTASPSDSFVYPHREDWITKQIEFTAPSGGTATINLRRRYSHKTSPLDAVDESSYRSELKSFRRTGPLYRQQRCYQEALLGTRVISFTSAAINVSCRRHNQCTGDVASRYHRHNVFGALVCAYEDPAIYKLRLAKYQNCNTSFYDGIRHTGPCREEAVMWFQAVMQYTARDMTVSPKDKLSGIAGLANMTGMGQLSLYFAGLWKCNLHEGLLWEVRLRPGQANTARITFPFKIQKAPTLSWASVDAGVHYAEPCNYSFVPDAKIAVDDTMNKADSFCADVEGGGVLEIRGRLIRCEVSQMLSGASAGAKGKLSVAHFYMEGKKGRVKTKRVPFVADGSLVVVKNRKARRIHSRKGAAACSHHGCRCIINKRKLVSQDIDWDSATFLARNRCQVLKKLPSKHGQTKIVGAAFVVCLGWRGSGAFDCDLGHHEHRRFEGLVVTPSLRFPGSYERIGCIRNIPAAVYEECKPETILLV